MDATGRGAGWLELSVIADPEAVEAVAEILARVAPAGVSIEPAFELVDEGLAARVVATRPAIVRAYLAPADGATTAGAVERTRTALGHLQAFGLRPIGDLLTRRLDDEDWATAWKDSFPVLRIGRRFVIRPTWRRHRRLPGDVVLALDPGVAFGTGLHPTTRLCLEGLEAWAGEGRLDGATVLDVGCGSGILGIGAARLGAASVLGVDVDPLAVEAAAGNARRNGLARRVRVRNGSVPTDAGPFDLVLANLIASLLVELAPLLRDEMRTGGPGGGGRLLASGVFEDRERDVRGAFEGHGLEVTRSRRDGEWVSLEAVRRG